MNAKSRMSFFLLIAFSFLALPAFAGPFEVEVTIENVSPDGGPFLTPVWVGFHRGDFDTYDGGVSLDGFPGLESLVEDGNTGPLTDSFAGLVPAGVQGTMPGPGGPIFPGDKAIQRFTLASTYHSYFSYVSMIIPSNDAFVANGNPTTHRVFDTDGVFTPFEFYILGNEVNDGGTEVNDEIPGNTAALAQAAPNTGVDENGVVTPHPGFIPGGNILAAIPNGQFTRPGYQVAKVTVRAAPTTSVRFYADESQESTPTGSDATGACSASLNAANNRLTVSCEHDVEGVNAAHVHLGPAGTDGPVVFPFDDPTSPFSQTFEVTADDVVELRAGNFYVNIHSDAFPAGEIRGQIVGCFSGPESLCLNNDRFYVAADFTGFDGPETRARVIPQSDDSGLIYFFTEDNIELLIKVLDFCADSNSFAVFASGITNLAVDLYVIDTLTGDMFTINNPLETDFPSVLDIEAFPNSCL